MKTFMLIMHLANPQTAQYDTYVMDLNLSAEDCIARMHDFTQVLNPNAHFLCEKEVTKQK